MNFITGLIVGTIVGANVGILIFAFVSVNKRR